MRTSALRGGTAESSALDRLSSERNGRLIFRVQVGPQIVSCDATLGGPLDCNHAGRRALPPLAYRCGGNAERISKSTVSAEPAVAIGHQPLGFRECLFRCHVSTISNAFIFCQAALCCGTCKRWLHLRHGKHRCSQAPGRSSRQVRVGAPRSSGAIRNQCCGGVVVGGQGEPADVARAHETAEACGDVRRVAWLSPGRGWRRTADFQRHSRRPSPAGRQRPPSVCQRTRRRW